VKLNKSKWNDESILLKLMWTMCLSGVVLQRS
jgi:hypothetical protein